jgi:hypothetical protein
MNRIIWIIGFCILVKSISLNACNACGSDFTSRIYPGDFNRFVGFGYSINHFKGSHNGGSTVNEFYHRADAFAKMAFGPRVEMFLNMPYQMTIISSEGSIDNLIQGIGDMAVIGRFALHDSIHNTYSNRFVMGAGIEAPTGRNNLKSSTGEIVQPYQPGSGSWDFILTSNYAIRNANYGFVADVNYKLHTKNNLGSKRPDFISINLETVKYISLKKYKLIPKIALGFDQSFSAKGKDSTLNFTQKRHFLTAGCGLDIVYKNYFLSTNYKIPIYQPSVTTQQLANANRFQISFGFIF